MLCIFKDERRGLGAFASNPFGTDSLFPTRRVASRLCGRHHTARLAPNGWEKSNPPRRYSHYQQALNWADPEQAQLEQSA